MYHNQKRLALVASLVVLLAVIALSATRMGTGNAIFPVQMNGRYAFIDGSGKMVVQPQFQDAGKFEEGLAPVKVNGRWGYINKDGKYVWNPLSKGRPGNPPRAA